MNVLLHPELRAFEAEAVAAVLGCRIVWCGNRYVLSRVRKAPRVRVFRRAQLMVMKGPRACNDAG